MIIVHDFFSQNGGGENLVISLASELNIKIYSAYNTKNNNNLIKTSKIAYILSKSRIFVFLFFRYFFKITTDGNILFSGNHCAFSIIRCQAKKKILYAHSLPKSLFSNLYLDHSSSFVLKILKKYQINKYYKNLISLDKIIFNSKKTKLKFLYAFKDLDKFVSLDVVYPFSDLEFKSNNYFTKLSNIKYFVINSRHQPYKNIQNIFLLLFPFLKLNKDIKIYVTHEGSFTSKLFPSDDEVLEQIIFTGYLEREAYQNLLLNSLGVIFPSIDEDFGISALDAYNLNTPVIVQKNCGFSEILFDDYKYFYDNSNLIKIINTLISKRSDNKIIYKNKINYKKLFFEKINDL